MSDTSVGYGVARQRRDLPAPIVAELGVDVGARFGRLVIQERIAEPRQTTKWRCACDCGGEVTLATYRLKQTKTPGCRACSGARQARAKTTHGDFVGVERGSKNRLWRIWASIRERCGPAGDPMACYRTKGISVCEEWRDFLTFRAWALSHGYADDLSIERRNAWGNYEPGNCEWITQAENSRRAAATATAKRRWQAPAKPWNEPHFPIEMFWGAC